MGGKKRKQTKTVSPKNRLNILFLFQIAGALIFNFKKRRQKKKKKKKKTKKKKKKKKKKMYGDDERWALYKKTNKPK